jgi:hypothetical protein
MLLDAAWGPRGEAGLQPPPPPGRGLCRSCAPAAHRASHRHRHPAQLPEERRQRGSGHRRSGSYLRRAVDSHASGGSGKRRAASAMRVDATSVLTTATWPPAHALCYQVHATVEAKVPAQLSGAGRRCRGPPCGGRQTHAPPPPPLSGAQPDGKITPARAHTAPRAPGFHPAPSPPHSRGAAGARRHSSVPPPGARRARPPQAARHRCRPRAHTSCCS